MTTGLPQSLKQGIRRQEQRLLEEGRSVNFRRVRERVFYSRHLFTPGKGGFIPEGTYQLFTTVAGGTGQGYASALTERETNWPQTGRLSSQQNLVAQGIFARIMRPPSDPTVYPAGVDVDYSVPMHPEDLASVARGMVLEIKYVTEQVPMGILADFPAPGGVEGFVQASRQAPGSVFGVAGAGVSGTVDTSELDPAQAVQAYGQHPLPVLQTVPCWMRKFAVPLLIGASEQFSAQLQVYEPIPFLGDAPAENVSSIFRYSTGACEVEIGLWCIESFDEQS